MTESDDEPTLDIRRVFEAIEIPTIVLDADGDAVVWNEAEEAVTGIDRGEIEGLDNIGEHVYDGERRTILAEKVVEHPEDAHENYDIELADPEYALLDVEDRPTYEDTSTVVGGTGEDIWFHAVPLYADGAFVGALEFTQEQTDSERQRLEMMQLIDQLEETLAAFQEGDFSAHAEYDFVNSVLDPEEIELLDRVNHLARMREALRDQVAETEAAKRDLERQNERLERFANVVSHDLRNPLNVATSSVELARTDETDREEALEKVEAAHDRMEDIIDELLRFTAAGGTVEATEPVSVRAVAEAGWSSVETGESTLDNTAMGERVEADADRFRTVFENLFRNAIEHNEEPVTVRVAVETEDGEVARVSVADEGAGIPPGRRETVFEQGYTTDERGTGFGLSIVTDVISAHGWQIEVRASDEGGARFDIDVRE